MPEVRLVGPQGEQVGIVRLEQALQLAREADLDLVEVAPDARPPVCKLMDYGKFKYENAQKARESRRNQAHTVIMLRQLAEDVSADGVVEQAPRLEGRNMHMVLAPTRKKSEARAEEAVQRERRAAERQAAAEEERRVEAQLRAQGVGQPKKKRGPSDNMDPDIDL